MMISLLSKILLYGLSGWMRKSHGGGRRTFLSKRGREMGELCLNREISQMASIGRVTDDDVLSLRRTVFKEGVVLRSEAEMLFALDRALKQKTQSWVRFFVEAVTDYLVMVEAPKGYVSEENAQWLIRAISTDGCVDATTELEVLLSVVDRAVFMPSSLSAFALKQVEIAVLEGRGALVEERSASKGIVTSDDVKLIRRVLYANSGARGLGISREEAEVLFNINDNVIEAASDSSWSDLFSKAIAFSLMAATGYLPISREKAIHRREWLENTSIDISGFLSRIMSGNLQAAGKKMLMKNKSSSASCGKDSSITAQVDYEEASWLMGRIMNDSIFHENESLLISFLKKEAPNLHPSLKPLLDQVA